MEKCTVDDAFLLKKRFVYCAIHFFYVPLQRFLLLQIWKIYLLHPEN